MNLSNWRPLYGPHTDYRASLKEKLMPWPIVAWHDPHKKAQFIAFCQRNGGWRLPVCEEDDQQVIGIDEKQSVYFVKLKRGE